MALSHWVALFREVTYLDSLRWNAPRSDLPKARQERLLAARDRAYSRFDAAKERTALYSVIANGAGVASSIAFLAERDEFSEGATLIAMPLTLFAIGLGLGFGSLYFGELYRRLQVKTIDASLRNDEERKAVLRQLRRSISPVLRALRFLGLMLFCAAVALATYRAWTHAPSPVRVSEPAITALAHDGLQRMPQDRVVRDLDRQMGIESGARVRDDETSSLEQLFKTPPRWTIPLANLSQWFDWEALAALATFGALCVALSQVFRTARFERLRAASTLTRLMELLGPVSELSSHDEEGRLVPDFFPMLMEDGLLDRAISGISTASVDHVPDTNVANYVQALPLVLESYKRAISRESANTNPPLYHEHASYIAEAYDYFHLLRQVLLTNSLKARRLLAKNYWIVR